ncbi:MAG: hypothetical protein J6T10_00050 [Methanobrevibacter sp.]|nr:hypothetical protein [Methanobrevibacter sp.]
MIFYILVYTSNGNTFRILFNSELKRSNYIEQHNVTDYTVTEFIVEI